MKEQILNPYLAEMERMEKLRAAMENLAYNYRQREQRAFDQIEAAKVRALQFELKQQGMELCAADFSLIPECDTVFYYDLTFHPDINTQSPGVWTPNWQQRIQVLCIDHIPEDPTNFKVHWSQEFPPATAWVDWYIKLYIELCEDFPYQNIHSLLNQQSNGWVRVLDDKVMENIPVTRIYPSQLFTDYNLPLPDPTKLNLSGYRHFSSPLEDPGTEVIPDEEAWDKLFN
jgi:hypothetical protein